MTLEEFEIRIARYGTTLAQWPEADRRAGEALLAHSAAARDLLAEQQQLDRLFAAAPAIVAPAGFQARVLAAATAPQTAAPRRPFRLALRESLAAFWPQMVGLAAASVLGFMIGVTDLGLVPVDQGSDFSAYIVGYGDETSLAAIMGEP